MEKNKNELSGLKRFIKNAANNEEFMMVAVEDYGDKVLYGRMDGGILIDSEELKNVDRTSLCQDIYEYLESEFDGQLSPYHIHSFDGNYEYAVDIGDSGYFMFPKGYRYQEWICNRIKADEDKKTL